MQDDIICRVKLKLFNQDVFKILSYATNVKAAKDREELKKTLKTVMQTFAAVDMYIYI